MNKNYRGPAESKELSEDGPAIDQADKGSAKHKKMHKGSAKYKKGSADYDVKKGSHEHPHGAAQSDEEILKMRDAHNRILQYGKDTKAQMEEDATRARNDFYNAGILDSINLEKAGKGKTAKDIYGENYGQKEGNSKSSYDVKKDMSDDKKNQILEDYKASEFYSGPGKMGYTQNFGPARQNGYAKGAAKVNEIMGKGSSRQKYGGNKGDESRSKKDYEG